MKNYLKLILKIVVSVGLGVIIYLKVDKQALVHNIALLNWKYVPIILLGLVLNYVISSVRWKKLLIYDNTSHISVGYLTMLYFIGSFFNNLMPTSIGGDVYKVYRLSKKIGNVAHAFAATFMERFTGVLALITLSLFSLYNIMKLEVILLLIWFAGAVYIGLLVLRFLSKKSAKIKKFYDALYMYKGNIPVLSFALVTSFLVQLLTIFTQYFIFKSIGVTLPIFYSLMVFPVIILASFFIPSINGIGVQDALYIQLFGLVGVSSSVALSASLLFHVSRLLVSLVGGAFYALGKDA
jgi:uncharacterized membrane protein YbhN (UPF0104 family)